MKDVVNISKRQAAIIAYILQHSVAEDNVRLLGFSLAESDAPNEQVTAYAKIAQQEDEIFLIFTLSDFSDRIFMTVSDGDPRELSKVLATLEEYDYVRSKLGVGSSVKMPSEYLDRFGKVGVILLAASTSPLLATIGACITIQDRNYHPLFVTFVDVDEYKLKLDHGFDELLNRFERTDKDIVTLGKV